MDAPGDPLQILKKLYVSPPTTTATLAFCTGFAIDDKIMSAIQDSRIAKVAAVGGREIWKVAVVGG